MDVCIQKLCEMALWDQLDDDGVGNTNRIAAVWHAVKSGKLAKDKTLIGNENILGITIWIVNGKTYPSLTEKIHIIRVFLLAVKNVSLLIGMGRIR